jgi:ATP-binding cassette subfamily B protein
MAKKDIYQQYHIQQRDQSDCGVACLASLVKYFGSDISLEKLREVSGTSKEGTTLLGLYQAANEIGLNAEGFEAEIKHLKDLEHPAILHVVLEGKLQHYVIVYGYENDHFIISDPSRFF